MNSILTGVKLGIVISGWTTKPWSALYWKMCDVLGHIRTHTVSLITAHSLSCWLPRLPHLVSLLQRKASSGFTNNEIRCDSKSQRNIKRLKKSRNVKRFKELKKDYMTHRPIWHNASPIRAYHNFATLAAGCDDSGAHCWYFLDPQYCVCVFAASQDCALWLCSSNSCAVGARGRLHVSLTATELFLTGLYWLYKASSSVSFFSSSLDQSWNVNGNYNKKH